MDDQVRGFLMAHEVVLIMLASRLNWIDAEFGEWARGQFDSFLGEQSLNESARDEVRVAARRIFTRIVMTLPESSGKKLSLRRRFLNWLMRG